MFGDDGKLRRAFFFVGFLDRALDVARDTRASMAKKFPLCADNGLSRVLKRSNPASTRGRFGVVIEARVSQRESRPLRQGQRNYGPPEQSTRLLKGQNRALRSEPPPILCL
jgi:hypothetical protein